MDYTIPVEKLGDGIEKIITSNAVCRLDFEAMFWWFWFPVLLMLLMILLMKYKEEIRTKLMLAFSKQGYIRIYLIKENKKIVKKLVKLDSFNNFKIQKRKYNLEKMYDFLLGYDEHNFPVFLYDYQFILPLKITAKTVTKQIKEQLGAENLEDSQISALTMKLDSAILKTVYDKKLISDLYSISGDSNLRNKVFWAIVGGVVLILLWYTGYLDKIISYVI